MGKIFSRIGHQNHHQVSAKIIIILKGSSELGLIVSAEEVVVSMLLYLT